MRSFHVLSMGNPALNGLDLYGFIQILALGSLAIQLYFLGLQTKLALYKETVQAKDDYALSVIICARNEAQNLQKNLPVVLAQDYKDFEVVVVNDCSSDNSQEILQDMSARFPHLRVVTIKENKKFKHGKKFAVTLGIKAAKHEHLVFTDADCLPASPRWLQHMKNHFLGCTEIVLGYSPYLCLPGVLNKFIRYEAFLTALNYISLALNKNPYMGVGRNLAYTKSLFFSGKGFASHMHILSGDDDLFVNQHATASNTAVEIHSDAHVWSSPKETFKDYIKQKKRHLSAGANYKAKHRRILSLQSASAVVFYLSLFFLSVVGKWEMAIALYGIFLIFKCLVYWLAMKRLTCKGLMPWLPLLDFLYCLYTIYMMLIPKKQSPWK